jgi:hypothetical protein
MSNFNPQRNSNCIVQASQFNGGNLAQSFNLQNMRIIKAYASINPETLYTQTIIFGNQKYYFTLIVDKYGAPIQLPPSGFIVSMCIENGSEKPLKTPGNINSSIFVALQLPPTYDNFTDTWVPSVPYYTKISILPPPGSIELTSLNAGFTCNPYINYPPSANFLGCFFTESPLKPVITTPNPSLVFTILIFTPQ